MIKVKYSVTLILMLLSISLLSAGAVLDIANPDVTLNKSQKRTYVNIQNIGDTAGTFTVAVSNVTDPDHIIHYENKDLKSLPVLIKPILIYQLKAKAKKRITLTRNPRVKLGSPIQLELAIKEYKKPESNTDNAKGEAGIQVQGAIVNLVHINVES